MLSAVVELVADLDTSRGSEPSVDEYGQVAVNGITFFTARTLTHGRELWRTDGTDAGTFRITDIMPGPIDSDIEALTKFGDLLIFTGGSRYYERKLWQSDGTVAGTQLMHNPALGLGSTRTSVLPVIGEEFFFASGDGLWKSDGTDEGTHKYFTVDDVGFFWSMSPASNGKFFCSNTTYNSVDNKYETSLWVSDGTDAGSRSVQTFETNSSIQNWVLRNGRVFFYVDTETDGGELWVSDGTDEGTKLVTKNPTGTQSWWHPRMVATEDNLYFTVSTQANSDELWAYRYADEAVIRLTNSEGSPERVFLSAITQYENNVYFVSNEGLWRTNGQISGTTLFRGPIGDRVRSLANINESLVLSVWDEDHGASLWTSDGTEAGTKLLKDAGSATGDITNRLQPFWFPSTSLSGAALFLAVDSSYSYQIWTTDGRSSATHRLADIATGTDDSNPDSIATLNGELIFLTGQAYRLPDTLWSSQTETHSLINQGGALRLPAVDGHYYYIKDPHAIKDENFEVYRWNGIDGEFILNIPFQFQLTSPPLKIAGANYFLGQVYSSTTGRQTSQLRRSIDGGTDSILVKEFEYGIEDSEFNSFTHNDLIFFLLKNDVGQSRLWRSDGTVDGTFMLLDSRVYGFESLSPHVAGSGNGIIVNSSDGPIITDGSIAGTQKLLDWLPGIAYAQELAVLPDKYLFTSGTTLWATDGTEAGTVPIMDMEPGYFHAATASDRFVYFFHTSGYFSQQMELWKSDGTASGTQFVFRFDSPIGADNIKDLRIVGDKVIFTILDDSTGYRTIWISDGTEAGTLPLRNNLDGRLILERDAQFTLYNDGIAFQAATEDVGYELFRINTTMPVAAPEQLSVTGDSEQKSISWPEVSGTLQYEVWLQNMTDKSLPPIRFRTDDSLIDIHRFDGDNYSFDYDLYPEFAPKIRFDADLPDGTYRIWVRSLPVLGKPSAWSARKDFIIAAQPDIYDYHDSNRFSQNYRPLGQTLEWYGSTNTVSYEIWIVNRDTKKFALRKNSIPGTAFELTDLLVRGNYTALVRGQLADQTFTEWSSPYGFYVLGSAVPLTSTNISTNNSRPELTWSAVDGATGYDVYVYLQNSATLVYSAKNVNALTHTPQKDLPGGKLLVYVRALKKTQPISAWGAGTVLWMKLPPILLRTTATGFAWNPVPQARSYTFELRGTNGALYVPRKTQSGTTIDFGKPLPPGKYSLRVVASYSKVTSVWSETLTVELFHPPVSITSSGAATVDATPTISWTAATDASSYEVLVTKPGSSVPIYTRTGITSTSHRIDVPLAAGISLFQVRAIFPDGSRSSLSAVQSLTIGIGTPVTFSTGSVSWNSVNSATNYELWINYLGTPNRRQIVHDPMYLKSSYKLPPALPKGRYQTWLRPVRAESGQLYYGAWTSVLFDIV